MHGTSLLTEDIDICAVLSPENIEKLSFIEFPEDISGINNLYIKTDMGQIELLGSVSGVGDFDAVSKRAIEITLFGRKCKVISLDDLIIAKKFVGRPHDLETVKQLEWIKKRLGDNE